MSFFDDYFDELDLVCATDEERNRCRAAQNNSAEMNLSNPENIENACALINAFTNAFTNNSLLNLLFDKEEPEEEDYEEDDDDLYEVDSEYIANAYLEEKVPGYETLDTEQKNRIIARLADFLEWFNTEWVDDDGCDL